MANDTGAFGLKPVRRLDGSPYNGATIPCYVSSSYATALFIGDPVLISPTLAEADSTGRYPTINASAGTDGTIIFGVITSFEPLPTDLTKQYNPASTERIANVCVDNDVIYHIRGDGGGTPAAVFVNQNAVMIATSTGSTTTGISGFHLDEGTTTAPAANQSYPLYIMGITDKSDNTLADNAVYEVLLNTNLNATGDRLGVTAA
jgi:hypothetical protein